MKNYEIRKRKNYEIGKRKYMKLERYKINMKSEKENL